MRGKAGGGSGRSLGLIVRRPEREVVAEQLHDEGGVLVAVLVERVELGDRVVERLLRNLTCLLMLALHLVQEAGVTARQAQTDRMRRRQRTPRLQNPFVRAIGRRRTVGDGRRRALVAERHARIDLRHQPVEQTRVHVLDQRVYVVACLSLIHI